jgi:hypothetical protein
MNAHAAAIETFINETTRCFGAPPASVVLRRGEKCEENHGKDKARNPQSCATTGSEATSKAIRSSISLDEGSYGLDAARSQSATPLWNAPSSFTAAIRYRRVSAGRVADQIRKGMEMDYDNTNRGALFRNDDKDPSNDKDRDYSGSLNVEGTEYWISGYVRTSKSGRKFLSLSIKPKQDKPLPANKSRADDFGDEIAF